jgi:hypothetical protein
MVLTGEILDEVVETRCLDFVSTVGDRQEHELSQLALEEVEID